MKKVMIMAVFAAVFGIVGCDMEEARQDQRRQMVVGNTLAATQPTPTDIKYSLERYNLIRRTYWVNGMRERAATLPCPIEKPLGYVILLTQTGAVVGRFVVDGKLSSLQNYLTPVSEEYASSMSRWLADVDGTFGDNDKGVFFFTPDGKYVEWNQTYLYSDIPFEVKDPVVTMKMGVE